MTRRVEQDGPFSLGQAIAGIDTDRKASRARRTVSGQATYPHFEFFHRNLFVVCNRRQGQHDSAAKRGCHILYRTAAARSEPLAGGYQKVVPP